MEVENKEFDQLLEAIYMGKTTMKCSSDNKITQLCIDKKCRLNAGFCADDECDECSTHESGLCGSQKVKAVTMILQGICKSQKSFVEKLIMLQEKLINSIKERRGDHERELHLGFLTADQKELLLGIYLKQKADINSLACSQLIDRIKAASAQAEISGQQFLQQFEKEGGKMIQNLKILEDQMIVEYNAACSGSKQLENALQRDSMLNSISIYESSIQSSNDFDRFLQPQKTYQQLLKDNTDLLYMIKKLETQLLKESQNNKNLLKERRCSDEERQKEISMMHIAKKNVQKQLKQFKEASEQKLRRLEQMYQAEVKASELLGRFKEKQDKEFVISKSKIILEDNYDWKKFLFDSLEKPRHLQLLFRASEHNYSASAFHQKCKGIKHTLTIISTEYGSVIAGYTPAQWGPYTNPNKYNADPKQKSFLISLTHKKKRYLGHNTKAIVAESCEGPIFGEGDIFISDCCNQNNRSVCNSPQSYGDSSQGSYANMGFLQQQVIKPPDFPLGSFKVLEYQVFKVVWY